MNKKDHLELRQAIRPSFKSIIREEIQLLLFYLNEDQLQAIKEQALNFRYISDRQPLLRNTK
jgi:hypothetical protein